MSTEEINETKKKSRYSPPRVSVGARLDGESIEDWIRRETERHVEASAEMAKRREKIKETHGKKVAAGYAYLEAHNNHNALKKTITTEIRDFTREKKAEVLRNQKEAVTPAKKEKGRLERLKKNQLAKYNTAYNRYFNAIKVIIFRNMKSLCEIKHTWAEPQVKRSLQNTDLKQNHKINARAPIEKLKEKANAPEA